MQEFKMNKKKNIALIAHDGMKNELIAWANANKEVLLKHRLCGTGTTAQKIREKTNLEVRGFFSGPLGGDQQIGARIVEGKIDIMIFFWDPLTAQPHDPDVKALLRIAVLNDVLVAMGPATAEFILSSPLMDEVSFRRVLDYA